MTYFRRACDLEDREIGLSAISKIEYMLKETRIFLKKGDFSATRRMVCYNLVSMPVRWRFSMKIRHSISLSSSRSLHLCVRICAFTFQYDRTIKALTDVVDTDGDGQITYEELRATDAGQV